MTTDAIEAAEKAAEIAGAIAQVCSDHWQDPDNRMRQEDLPCQRPPGEHQDQTCASSTTEQWTEVPWYGYCMWHGESLLKPNHFYWDCQKQSWEPGCYCVLSDKDMEWVNRVGNVADAPRERQEQEAQLAVATAANARGGLAVRPYPDICHRPEDLQGPGEHQGQTRTRSRSRSPSSSTINEQQRNEQWTKVPWYGYCKLDGERLMRPKKFYWDCQEWQWLPGCFCELSRENVDWANNSSTH